MIILITGGASGLGEAITRKAAQDLNNEVYFTYSKSETNAKKIASDYSNAFSIKCDFKNPDEVEALKDRIERLQLDVLINNAYTGEPIKSYFHKIPPQSFLSDFKDNIIPTVIVTQSAINSFRKKKYGKIITILTSFLVNTPPLGSSIYVANKAYLEELMKVWATENAKYNITSNAISPSFMLTNLTNDTDERVIEQMIEGHPLKKILTTQEVAESVVFLINATQQLNGLNIVLNSGVNIK
jgi:3-oxoacyl-[acyl-carrier protein] reductase